MLKLKTYFTQTGFNEKDLEIIMQAFTLKSFRKNEFLVKAGKTSSHIGFVENGMFQYYVIKDGEERTSWVSIENTFFASLLSFLAELPSLENVRAITDSQILLISKPNLLKLIREVPAFKDFYIGLLESSICGIDASRHDLIVLTADQRYAKMLQMEPRMLELVPLQYLASMLGMTPRHLSRIRNNMR